MHLRRRTWRRGRPGRKGAGATVYVLWFTLGCLVSVGLAKYLTRQREARSSARRSSHDEGPTDIHLSAGPWSSRDVVAPGLPVVGDVLPSSTWHLAGSD